jgi:hypothetical protein
LSEETLEASRAKRAESNDSTQAARKRADLARALLYLFFDRFCGLVRDLTAFFFVFFDVLGAFAATME